MKAALEFSAAMSQAKESLQADLLQLERLVVAPTIDLIALLDTIKRYIVKRSHKLLDYDRHADSLKSMREKANRTISDEKKLSGLEANFDQASRDYNSINNQLKQDLTVFLSLRKDFIDPCLLTFYNYQIRVYDTLYRIYYQVGSTQFDLSTTALAGYQHVQEDLLAMLGSFTICKGVAKPSSTNALAEEGSAPPPSKFTPQPSYSQQLASKQSGANLAAAAPIQETRKSYDAPRADMSFAPPPARPVSLDTGMKSFVVALYDFDAQAEGDLAFKRDDKIEILERKDDINDWWTGRIGDRVGVFPGTFLL